MKALIFLVVLGLVVGTMFWWLRKSQAEAEAARLKALKDRKKRDKKVITPEIDMVWPVIVKPVTGEGAPGKEEEAEEPTMTTIEFESSESSSAQRGGSK